MWTLGVVFLKIVLAKHSRLEQVTEDFSAEECVPESTVKAFDVVVFPGSTGRDKPSLDIEVSQVALEPSSRSACSTSSRFHRGNWKWSGAVLCCEIGDITRFSSAKKLIAYAGLDPQREESGDIAREKMINKQEGSHIRSVLYGYVTAVIRNSTNPTVRDLYDRLKERGKHRKGTEVTCIRKLLAIVHGWLEQQQAVRPDVREALESSTGVEESH